MERESSEGRTLSLDLPAALDEWLSERASELDVDRSELVIQLIGGYQVAADTADEESIGALETTIEEGRVDIDAAVQEAIAEAGFDDRVDALEAEMNEKLEDVRRRVIQVKQETDAKAPADHTHPELEQFGDLAEEVTTLRDEVAALEPDDDREADLADALQDVQGKLNRLARVVVQLRDAEEDDDEVLADIRRTAAREGWEEADCGACGETVRVGLLPEAACPHCRSSFGDIVDSSGGLFGSKPRLVGPHDEPPTDGGGAEGRDTGTAGVSGLDAGTGGDGTAPAEDSPDEGRTPAEDAEDDDGTATTEDPTDDDGNPVSTDGGTHD